MEIQINRPLRLAVFFKHFNKFLGTFQYIEKDLFLPSGTSIEQATAEVEKTYPNYFFFNWKGTIVKKVQSEHPSSNKR